MAGWLFGGSGESGGCIPSLAAVDESRVYGRENDRDSLRQGAREGARKVERQGGSEREREREIRGDER